MAVVATVVVVVVALEAAGATEAAEARGAGAIWTTSSWPAPTLTTCERCQLLLSAARACLQSAPLARAAAELWACHSGWVHRAHASLPRVPPPPPRAACSAKFEKNFYMEHPNVTGRTDDEVEAYRQTKQIHVYGEGVPKPVTTFEEASFPGLLLDAAGCWVQAPATPTAA